MNVQQFWRQTTERDEVIALIAVAKACTLEIDAQVQQANPIEIAEWEAVDEVALAWITADKENGSFFTMPDIALLSHPEISNFAGLGTPGDCVPAYFSEPSHQSPTPASAPVIKPAPVSPLGQLEPSIEPSLGSSQEPLAAPALEAQGPASTPESEIVLLPTHALEPAPEPVGTLPEPMVVSLTHPIEYASGPPLPPASAEPVLTPSLLTPR